MRRVEMSPIGSADEARTPPASAPPSCPGPGHTPGRPRTEVRASAPPADVVPAAALEQLLARATEHLRRGLSSQESAAPLPHAHEVVVAGSGGESVVAALTELLRAVQASRHAALHDPLTGLANRALILEHLRVALARAARGPMLAAVVFFDLDGFKQINDTLGHLAGDDLLVRIAQRCRPLIRPADTLGRWGGDEFVVVCEDLERASDATAIVSRIASAFEAPFEIGHAELHVGASIGVAVSGGADQPATLIHAADSAMYRAKQDPASRRGRRRSSALPGAVGLPKQERLTRALFDLLSSVEVDDLPGATNRDGAVGAAP